MPDLSEVPTAPLSWPTPTPRRLRRGPRSPVTVLLVLAASALLTAGVLGLVTVVSPDRPQPCCRDGLISGVGPQAVDDPEPTAQRLGTLPLCLIGSWQSTMETVKIRFFAGLDPIPFTYAGRTVTYRPDGTGTTQESVLYRADHQGQRLRVVAKGGKDFTWTATGTTITYHAVTATTLTYAFYLDDQEIGTSADETGPLNEVDSYTCAKSGFSETNTASGYRSSWTRTDEYGRY